MNIQTRIPARLWDSVQSSYESENYAHAILAAIALLTTVLREKAGVDGDGVALVGQALGGDQPKLRINSLQTESEKNSQRGIEQILRGIYVGIRNPRSHDQIDDSKETADAIIHFVGYLLNILNASRDVFSVESFLERVYDTEFVSTIRYSELIVSEIPALRVGEALIALFNERKKLDFKKHKYLVRALIDSLTPIQKGLYLSIVSNEFRTVSDDRSIRTALQMLTADLWDGIDELPRLRIENKLITGLETAEADVVGASTAPLSTWSSSLLKSFTSRKKAAKVVIERLESREVRARTYILRFMFTSLDDFITDPIQIARAIKSISNAVKSGDEFARQTLVDYVSFLNETWQNGFSAALLEETDQDNPAVLLHDGRPFLSSPENQNIDDLI